MKCKAKSKRSQKQCGRNASRGFEVCNIHGGKSRVGALHPNYKHGLYSKFLPSRFAHLFESLEGSDILDLTEDAKLLKVRIIDLIKRVDAGESGTRWKQALQLFRQISKAKEPEPLLAQLGEVLEAGVSDFAAWEAIEELIVKKTKVVESQRKRAIESDEMLTAQDAREMMRAITEGLKLAVEEHVKDDKLKRQIFTAASSKFAGIVNSGHHKLVSAADH